LIIGFCENGLAIWKENLKSFAVAALVPSMIDAPERFSNGSEIVPIVIATSLPILVVNAAGFLAHRSFPPIFMQKYFVPNALFVALILLQLLLTTEVAEPVPWILAIEIRSESTITKIESVKTGLRITFQAF
jgi:hypothetical protein